MTQVNPTKPTGSLAAKLLRVVLGIYLSLAVLVTIGQLFLEYRNEKRRLTVEINSAAQTFGPILSQALWNVDDEQTRSALAGVLGINYDVLQVQLLDPDGKLIHQLQSASPQTSPVQYLPFLRKDPGSPLYEQFNFGFDLTYNSQYTGEQKVGSLVLSSDSHVVLNRAAHTFLITIISAVFKTALLWLIFYFIMRRMVDKPLTQVTRAMTQLNPNSKEDASHLTIDPELLSRDDELGAMTQTFKEMEMALHERNRTLHEYQTHLEEKIKERTLQLEMASQAKTDFLAAMSHEIRTPMNGVIGMTQLLAGMPLNERQMKYVKVIQNSSESLIEIINGILDHLKIDAGKMELESTDFSLESLFDDCIALFTHRSKESNITITPVFKPDCPTWVAGDPTRLRQIIINLLGNAFKFTREGEIVLQAQQMELRTDGTSLIRISVKDTGIGIEAEKQRLLFTPFNQADTSTTRRYGGTGLGLSICKRLTEIMGGSIGVISEVGHGSTFWIQIPLQVVTAPVQELDEKGGAQSLQGKRLLIVDDHPTFCEITMEVAENCGMVTTVLTEGANVIATLESVLEAQQAFDLVIIDIALPDMSGLNLAQKITSHFQADAPRLLLVSAYQDFPTSTILKQVGASLFLEKPITNRELRRALIQSLSAPGRERPPAPVPAKQPFEALRVLVAEDNAVNQMVITGFLSRFGITPVVVDNGQKAINECTEDSYFDLILMDGEMPEVDGWEATRQIRSLHRTRADGSRIKIIALSAHAMEPYLVKARECGMDGYLCKPFTMAQLQALLDELVNDSLPPEATQYKR